MSYLSRKLILKNMASLEEIRNNRLEKLKTLAQNGIESYPISSNRNYELEKDIADFDNLSNNVDIGYFIEVKGSLFITKRGEKTIKADSWKMLSKSLRTLPEKWHGLS